MSKAHTGMPQPIDALDTASTAQRILVIKLGAMGDIILADGAMQDLRAQHAQAHISVLTRAPFVPLLRRCPWIDDIIVDANAPRWRLDAMLVLRRQLRGGSFERVYDLQNSRRTAFYRRWLANPQSDWSVTPRTATGSLPGSVPERHAVQLERAGVASMHSRRPAPSWIADDVGGLLQRAGIESPYVVLLPGSSARHPHKRWPHYAALSRALRCAGLRVVTIPGIDELALGSDYDGIVLRRDGRALNLFELAGVLRGAACVVGNDSGPTHLAACLDVDCVALFDARNPSLRATGIEQRHATCLIGDPIAAIAPDAVRDAVLARLMQR